MKVFKKGDFVGHLRFITVYVFKTKSGKDYLEPKQVLTLVDEDGERLIRAQFRKDATKKAEQFLISLGWTIEEL